MKSTNQSANACTRDLSEKAFKEDESLDLAGAYELTMMSQWEDESGKRVDGQLELWAPDTLFQRYEPSWYAKYDPKTPRLRLLPRDSVTTWTRVTAWRPLIGTVDIDLDAVSATTGDRLKSRDPFKPGVRMEGRTLELSPVPLGFVQFDGSSTSLEIERTGDAGFSGHWTTSFSMGVIVRNGREVRDPFGVFCARRVSGSGSRVRADGAFVFGEIGSSEYGQQVQGARVDLLTADRVTGDSAITDAHGRFLIGPVAPGSYDLLVRPIAHQRAFLKVTLKAVATDTVRIVLKYDTSGMIADCIGPDGWSFGSQYCKH